MLSKVIIDNFQSHRHTELDFSEGINVVIGTSDTGKSAICRALEWVKSNRPLGDDFRSDWGGDTSVELQLTDGNIVKRIKSDRVNMYVVNGIELRALGTDIPEEVTNILNLNAINFHHQLEGAFLLHNTSGEVAKEFNSAINLQIIDESISRASSYIRTVNQDIKREEKAKENFEGKLESYIFIDNLEVKYNNLERIYNELIEIKEQELSDICDLVVLSNKELEKYNNLDTIEGRVKNLQGNNSELEKKVFKEEVLKNLIEVSIGIEQKVKYLINVLSIENSVKEYIGINVDILELKKKESGLIGLKDEITFIKKIKKIVFNRRKFKNTPKS